jgi:hypothetical protein
VSPAWHLGVANDMFPSHDSSGVGGGCLCVATLLFREVALEVVTSDMQMQPPPP